MALVDVGVQDVNPVTLGILLQRFQVIETHGLLVEDGYIKF